MEPPLPLADTLQRFPKRLLKNMLRVETDKYTSEEVKAAVRTLIAGPQEGTMLPDYHELLA